MIKGYSQNKTILKAYSDVLPPTLTLSSKDLKDIKNWKVGETYDLCVTVKQKSIRQNDDGTTEATFDVIDVTPDDSGDDNGGD